MIDLPDFVEEQINELTRETEISADDLCLEYEEIFNNPLVQEDEDFETDKERHKYAIKILIMRKMVKPSYMSKLQDFVDNWINKLSTETKISADILHAEYLEILSDPFIQNDPQFVTETQRHGYAINILIARNRHLPHTHKKV